MVIPPLLLNSLNHRKRVCPTVTLPFVRRLGSIAAAFVTANGSSPPPSGLSSPPLRMKIIESARAGSSLAAVPRRKQGMVVLTLFPLVFTRYRAACKNIVIMLIGNKCDLASLRSSANR